MTITTTDLPLAIQPVRDRADFKKFIAMTAAVYADDPAFVQPLMLERLDHLNQKKNPFLRDIEAAYWIVYRGPQVVGRISAQVNKAHLARHQGGEGHFGFLEAIDDDEVFQLLLDTARIWLQQRGMQQMVGPFSLSINDESGTLIEGFEHRPNMMMPHGRPYYADRLAENGFTKAKDLIAFDIDANAPWPKATQRLLGRLEKMPGVSFRPLDMKRYNAEIALICDIFNDAWADNWGFIPFGDDEASYMAKSLKPLVNANCFAIGEVDGEPVAMAVALPNLNEAIDGLGGRIWPFGWAKLLWRLKVTGVKTWRIPLMGVRKRFHGSIQGAALTLGVIDMIKRYGQRIGAVRGELSWVLEDNHSVRQVIENVGAKPYKTYRVFQKAIG